MTGLVFLQHRTSKFLIDYLVGTPERLARRASVRVVPGAEFDLPEGACLVSLMAWRTADMDDDRWRRLCTMHEAEIDLIKGQIEHSAT